MKNIITLLYFVFINITAWADNCASRSYLSNLDDTIAKSNSQHKDYTTSEYKFPIVYEDIIIRPFNNGDGEALSDFEDIQDVDICETKARWSKIFFFEAHEFGIFNKNGLLLGKIKLYDFDHYSKKATLSYECTDHPTLKKAIKAVAIFCFEQTIFQKISIEESDKEYINTLCECGFTKEGSAYLNNNEIFLYALHKDQCLQNYKFTDPIIAIADKNIPEDIDLSLGKLNIENTRNIMFNFKLPIVMDDIIIDIPSPGDAEKFCEGMKTSTQSIAKWIVWLKERSLDDCRAVIRDYRTNFFLGETFWFFAFKKNPDGSKGEYIGNISLGKYNKDTRSAFAGYSVIEKHRSKGYATKMLKALMKFSFEQLNIYTIRTEIDAENIASIKVAKKCGFVLDTYGFRITPDIEGSPRLGYKLSFMLDKEIKSLLKDDPKSWK